MAHDLEIHNGEASMFYVGEPPWHRLGTPLRCPATAQQALIAAHLDWEVRSIPLYAGDSSRNVIRVEDRFGIVRLDTWSTENARVLGIVGCQYTPLQNTEAFEFFDAIAGQGQAIYHTAGALGDGERVWILAKLPEECVVAREDAVERYLLLSNSHDGSSSVQVKFTPIRVVCQNTLTMALSKGPTVRVSHTTRVKERLAATDKMLGIIRRRFEGIEVIFKEMAKKKLKEDQHRKYLSLVFPDPQDPADEKAMQKVDQSRLWATYFFENGKGNQNSTVSGSLWTAYNGITEWVDHRRASPSADKAIESMWFGDGYFIKARAFEVAKELLAA